VWRDERSAGRQQRQASDATGAGARLCPGSALEFERARAPGVVCRARRALAGGNNCGTRRDAGYQEATRRAGSKEQRELRSAARREGRGLSTIIGCDEPWRRRRAVHRSPREFSDSVEDVNQVPGKARTTSPVAGTSRSARQALGASACVRRSARPYLEGAISIAEKARSRRRESRLRGCAVPAPSSPLPRTPGVTLPPSLPRAGADASPLRSSTPPAAGCPP